MPGKKINRRKFLVGAGATGIAAGAAASLPASARAILWSTVFSSGDRATLPGNFYDNGTLVPDDGWHLWIDKAAQWQDDEIFLPENVKLETLPMNPPAGGWEALHSAPNSADHAGVTLPTTVEEHFWGRYGTRSYTPDEYRYAADDAVPQNGAYVGVSWWWRAIDIPQDYKGKRIFLHIRGARQRAEVFLNGKLVGYSILEELPFDCDLTAAANPGGENTLAIRITNPGGRYDWVDGGTIQWGKVKFHRSHGFGGLDRGMVLSAHEGAFRISELWALNTPQPKTIRVLHRVAANGSPAPQDDFGVSYEVVDPVNGKRLQTISENDSADKRTWPEGVKSALITCADAELWDLDSPKLYELRVVVTGADGKKFSRTATFGFRWFGPEGLGENAIFRLNGRRIKVYTAISWGFWGRNGLWPTPELAEKEVKVAKQLGLNCLNFHRNVGKEDVFRAHDRHGLLRYMEPGGGKEAVIALPGNGSASAPAAAPQTDSDADRFVRRYMKAKCVAMVRAFRSHPSLIEYCLQNEINADLKNPETIEILNAMRAEDPSRCIVLNDGFVARGAAQAWYAPYDDKLHRSDQEEAGGWWINHQGAGDQWYDEFYKDPRNFTYREPRRAQLVEFGEMEGCAVPDNHSLMIEQIEKSTGMSYDLADHKAIVAGYDAFLDRWGFRKAFPTAGHVFLAIGRKSYESWQQYLENVRLCDEVDFAAISGWESTAIENHSGIVDNLRNFKSDPILISSSLLPVRPVLKQRALVTAAGAVAVFDVWLLNDTDAQLEGELILAVVDPKGNRNELGRYPAPKHVENQFSYLLKEAFTTAPLETEGLYRFTLAITSHPASTMTREIWVANPNPYAHAKPLAIGVSGVTPELRQQLAVLGDVVDFDPQKRYDVLVSCGAGENATISNEAGDDANLDAPSAAAAPRRPARPLEPGEAAPIAVPGKLSDALMSAVRAGTPLLVMAQADSLAHGVATQLAAAGAFDYHGPVGDFRAPWMGTWYIVREHPVYSGLPVNCAMGLFYQAKGRQSNGLLIDSKTRSAPVEVITGYSRDHDRNVGAGTFVAKLGAGQILFQRVPEMTPVFEKRFLANAVNWLARSENAHS
ncbi:MAG: sugar-binding domain-containing protein [Candidatus Acidiferrales bacterium]